MMLLAAAAWAGGGGLYFKYGGGGAWTNASGPLVRGGAAHFEVGGYGGPYRRSMRYGRYNRVGMRVNVRTSKPFYGADNETVGMGVGLSLARGFDLMNIGYWTGLTIGPMAEVVLNEQVLSSDIEADGYLGLFVRGELGGLYNIWPAVGVGMRLELGVDTSVYPSYSMTVTGGFGVTVLFRLPVVTPKRELRRERAEGAPSRSTGSSSDR